MEPKGQLVDKAERKAIAARMRRGEPAPTAEQAAVEMAATERIVRAWWLPVGWLVIGLVNLVFLVSGELALWPLAVVGTVGTLGIGVWQELHRRGAARLLDANRRRWG